MIYSSDLGRALQTAELISDTTGQKFITDHRLRERHFSVLNGLFRYVIGIPLEAPRMFKLWNAGINTFSYKNGKWELHIFGDINHLNHIGPLDDA